MNAARPVRSADALLPAVLRLFLKVMLGVGALAALLPLLLMIGFVIVAAASPL